MVLLKSLFFLLYFPVFLIYAFLFNLKLFSCSSKVKLEIFAIVQESLLSLLGRFELFFPGLSLYQHMAKIVFNELYIVDTIVLFVETFLNVRTQSIQRIVLSL